MSEEMEGVRRSEEEMGGVGRGDDDQAVASVCTYVCVWGRR